MKRATDPRLRKALTDLLDARAKMEAAQRAREDAAKAYHRAVTACQDATQRAAQLLQAEPGVVTHDSYSFERTGEFAIRVLPVARELHVEQRPLLGEAHE